MQNLMTVPDLAGKKVAVGFSGGPDAAALAYRLRSLGAEVLPVYVDYRKTSGGKTAKDLRAARECAKLLGIMNPIELRAPLGHLPKSRRNRFFVKVFASFITCRGGDMVALGTMKHVSGERLDRATANDLDPEYLSRQGSSHGVRVLTWDTFGVQEKAAEFAGINEVGKRALFATTSCQLWWRVECGNCSSCRARHAAFLKVFGCDPTRYRKNSRVMREKI
jgi:7-cyano-7-deazaguanine synthase in queuosine biosynthesis